jgi:hypothetical protein
MAQAPQRRLDPVRVAALVAAVLFGATCSDARGPVTAPHAGNARPATLASVTTTTDVVVGAGNIARCGKSAPAATAAILDTIPGTVFVLGDNVYTSGSSADFTGCYDPSWGRHKARTRPAAGDKEYKTAGASGYFGYFGAAAGDPAKGYYSYDLNSWHVIVLNTGSSGISTKSGSPQELWLRADLAANSKPCIVAYWHYPLFSSSGSALRSSIRPLWDDLYAAHADLVVNAHARVYERFAPQTSAGTADPVNGIRQFTVGTGGQGVDAFNSTITANSEVRNSGAYGVLRLTLGAGGYSWTFIPIAGQSFTDAGSGSCHGGAAVAAVTVTPASATLATGSSQQLTAQPFDAGGNPLTGRTITWQTSDATVAAVSSTGLVTGVAVGTATITATSGGVSGTAAVTVVAPPPADAQCLDRLGPTITLNGLQTVDYSNTALANNTRVDASGAQFLTGSTHPVDLGGGSGGCFHSGEIAGQLPPSTDWNTMHDTYAFRTEGIPGFELEDTREFDYGDGISLKENTTAWVIRRVHFKYMRDDCVQNDWLTGGTIDSSFFEGCSTGISARPFTTVPDGSANVLVIKNSLFSLQDMDQGYDGPGHGGFFKWSPTGPMLSLHGNVFRVDSPSSLGTHSLGPPAGKVADCADNVMIWLGAGPFPETLPSCYTLLTGAAGLAYWNTAVLAWTAQHPNPLTDVTPPIVSLFAPQPGATLYGTVSLTATAVDDRQVAGVQLQLNGQNIGPELTAESPLTKFTLAWDSHALADGAYALRALARDVAGHVTTSAAISVAIDNQVSATQSTVSVSPAAIPAGTGSATVTVTVRDAGGQPLGGIPVALSASGSGNAINQPVSLTDPDGVTTGTLTSTVAGPKVVTAVAGGVPLSQQPTVVVTAGPPDGSRSTVNAAPSSITAGSAPATITVTVNDQFGNPVSGASVVLAATGTGNTLTQPTVPTGANGVATGSLGSTIAEPKVVSATAGGTPIAQTAAVTVLPAPGGAIAQALLAFGSDPTNQRTFTTASIAPAANALITIAVLGHNSTSAPPSPAVSGGGMTGWTEVASVTFDDLTTSHKRLTIFRAMSGAPGSGPLTITWSSTVSNCQWIVSQWTGVDASGVSGAGAIVQSASGRADASGGLALTLAPLAAAGNVAYGVFGVNSKVPAITAGTGYTRIDEEASGESPYADLLSEWALNRTVIDASWLAKNAAALGMEIRAAASP